MGKILRLSSWQRDNDAALNEGRYAEAERLFGLALEEARPVQEGTSPLRLLRRLPSDDPSVETFPGWSTGGRLPGLLESSAATRNDRF